MSKVNIAGLKIDAVTKLEFLAAALARIKAGQKTFVITPYSEFLYHGLEDPKLMEVFNSANFSLADGIGIFWAKRYLELPLTAKSYWGKVFQALWQLKYSLAAIIFNLHWIKSALPEKIVGADLVWDLAKMANENNLSIFLLGGFGDTAELTKQKILSKYPNILISTSNKNPTDLSVVDDVNNTKTDLLLVAYGPVKQEKWINDNLSKLNTQFAMGVGGTFDYIAGKQSSPPKFIRYSGLEWLWRLFTQQHRIKRIWNATFGLANKLWRYKIFDRLPIRPNVVAGILNKKKQILICQRQPKDIEQYFTKQFIENFNINNFWVIPQGGAIPGEDLVKTALREVEEETGLKKLEFLRISTKTNTYVWDSSARTFWGNRNYLYKGQSQNIVYFKFSGEDSEIKLDNRELVNFKWVDLKDVDKLVHPERQALAKIIQEDLKDLA